MAKSSFGDAIKQGIEIFKLNTKAISQVSKDPNATGYGLGIVALAGIAYAIGLMLIPGLIFFPAYCIVCVFISTAILHLLALLFNGKGDFFGLFRPLSVLFVIQWIAVVPIIGPLLGFLAHIWSLVVLVFILKTIYKLSTGKSVAIVVIIVLLRLLVIFVLFTIIATFLLAFLGALAAGTLAAFP